MNLRPEISRTRRTLAVLLLSVSAAAQQATQSTSIPDTLRHARDLRTAHQVEQAASLLSDLVAAHPDDPDALSALADVRIEQGNSTDAEQLLVHALNQSPNSPSANNLSGRLLLAQRRYPEAMDRFETVLSLNPKQAEARQGEFTAATQLALESRKEGRGEAALAALQHASQYLSDNPTLLLDLGIQAEQVHQLTIAQQALDTALKLQPGDPKILYALSRVELDRQQFPSSELHLRAYLAAQPDDASAHFGLGHLLEMQQRIDEAKAEFQRSIVLQPLQTESYYQLGQMALDAGQLDVAAPLFQKTLTRDPHHGGALTGVGILDYRRKDFASARSQLTAAVASSPNYQPAHYYLGLTLAKLGDRAASERELQTATELGRAQDPHAASAVERSAPRTAH